MPSRKIAIIGFGNQGRAWAVRLKSGRANVVVGLRSGSKSRREARRLGLTVETPERAALGCGVVALLVPDQFGRKTLKRIEKHLDPDCLVVFAAGYPLVFPSPMKSVRDTVLVAPHGAGRDLEAGARMSGFVAVAHDRTGKAEQRARSLARWLGLAPLYETTPRSEALGDLFGEQALLCGGLVGLTSAVAREMIRGGIPPAHAWLETVGQVEQLAGLLKRQGVEHFWSAISDCAAAGAASATPKMFGAGFSRALSGIWADIESGRFARSFEKQGRPAGLPAGWKVLAEMERSRGLAKKKGGRQGRPS